MGQLSILLQSDVGEERISQSERTINRKLSLLALAQLEVTYQLLYEYVKHY